MRELICKISSKIFNEKLIRFNVPHLFFKRQKKAKPAGYHPCLGRKNFDFNNRIPSIFSENFDIHINRIRVLFYGFLEEKLYLLVRKVFAHGTLTFNWNWRLVRTSAETPHRPQATFSTVSLTPSAESTFATVSYLGFAPSFSAL
ncbi:hypothetical protein SAMN05421890_4071 [Ensifer adhaerens]|nr:hypothetical protein SAMN05421890_4071 [Ensifer adhaerens]